MRLAAAGIIAGLVLYAGYQAERTKKEAIEELCELMRLLLFAAQEIGGRATPLQDLFAKAAVFCRGKAKCFSKRLAQGLECGEDFEKLWKKTAQEIYGETGLGLQERELLMYCCSSFLLPDRQMVGEQLSFDAGQLRELCGKRKQRLDTDCRLCRVLSFCVAAFLLILIW